MADNTIGWGQGSVNNTNDWGKGKANSTNGWGSIYANSPSGDTNIEGGAVVDDRFIITVKTDNAGTSGTDQFTIPTNTTGITQAFNYDIETSDGQTITGNTGDTTITFPSAGTYDVKISGSFPYMSFANGGDKLKLLDIKNFGIYALGSTSQNSAFWGCSNMTITATDSGNFGSVTNFFRTWFECSSLTSFPLIDTSNGTIFGGTWRNCFDLTSFPLIDTSSATTLNHFGEGAWQSCTSLTSFPLIDTSNIINFGFVWLGCSSLTSFPLIDTSSATSFNLYGAGAWQGCSSLTSFPLIDTSSATSFQQAWRQCSSLTTFPANAFDTNIATNYTNAFLTTNLTTQSIDDILVSLDTSGVSNGTFTQSGGQAPSATGEAAINSLVGKGWTITVTGGYQPTQLLLDEYPNAAAAYSLRELSTAFVGQPVVRVRRSDNNAEQDFTATEITDGTLTTFTGANDGFVTTWYDQSGNSKNLSTPTATEQPKIVSSGVLNLDNGKPYLQYLDNFAGLSGLNVSLVGLDFNNSSLFATYNSNSNSNGCLLGTINSGGTYVALYDEGSSASPTGTAGNPNYYTNSTIISPSTRGNLFNNIVTNQDVLVSVLNIDFSETTEWDTGGITPYMYRTNNFTAPLKAKEMIIYNLDQSANRTGIETNINTEYTIY